MSPYSSTRLLAWFVLTLLLVVFCSSSAHCQNTSLAPSRPHDIPPLVATDHEQVIPYWSTESSWQSEIQLRNNLAKGDLTVTPVLRLADGSETVLSPVVIKPQEIRIIDIGAAVTGTAPQCVGSYGSVALRYHSPSAGNLFAMLMLHDIGHSIAFHIDSSSEDQSPNPGGREGIWWLPNETASDYLILTNQGSAPLPVKLSLYDATGRESKHELVLPARATNRLSLRALVTTAGLTGNYGGIKILAPAHAGSLDSLHVVFDEKASFSGLLKMFYHDPSATLGERDYAHTNVWTLRAPMLALSHPDPALAFPEGTVLQPQIFVRNATAKPANISLRFNWRNSAGATGKVAGPSFILAANETRRIDIAALQASKVLPEDANWTSVLLTTNGSPDEVLAVAASYDATLRYGSQTPFSDQLALHWEGSLWEYDAQHNSLITAGNGGTNPIRASFTIYYNQGMQKYQLEQQLQPDEQMWIDVGRLVREKVPDKNGKTLPADVSSGSYELRDLTNKGIGTLFEGKVVYDKTHGHVTYGCAACCGYGATTPWYNPLGIPLGFTAPNGVNAYNYCDSNNEDVSDTFYGHWSSANQGFTTVDYYGTFTGVAVGATTSTATANLQSDHQPLCPILSHNCSGRDDVVKLQVQGNEYNSIFVGSDPNLAGANSIYASVSPTGGSFTETSSQSGDTFTAVKSGGPGWVVTTTTASSQAEDRTLTITYTVSGQGPVSQSLNVTARQFAYATNNSPSDTCTLGYGTTFLYTYTPYTHPDKTAVQAGLGLSGTAVTESFDKQPPAGTVTGSGVLDANSEFSDKLSYCSTSPLTVSTSITQTISIEGYAVRKNLLTYSSSGVTLENQGPTQ